MGMGYRRLYEAGEFDEMFREIHREVAGPRGARYLKSAAASEAVGSLDREEALQEVFLLGIKRYGSAPAFWRAVLAICAPPTVSGACTGQGGGGAPGTHSPDDAVFLYIACCCQRVLGAQARAPAVHTASHGVMRILRVHHAAWGLRRHIKVPPERGRPAVFAYGLDAWPDAVGNRQADLCLNEDERAAVAAAGAPWAPEGLPAALAQDLLLACARRLLQLSAEQMSGPLKAGDPVCLTASQIARALMGAQVLRIGPDQRIPSGAEPGTLLQEIDWLAAVLQRVETSPERAAGMRRRLEPEAERLAASLTSLEQALLLGRHDRLLDVRAELRAKGQPVHHRTLSAAVDALGVKVRWVVNRLQLTQEECRLLLEMVAEAVGSVAQRRRS